MRLPDKLQAEAAHAVRARITSVEADARAIMRTEQFRQLARGQNPHVHVTKRVAAIRISNAIRIALSELETKWPLSP